MQDIAPSHHHRMVQTYLLNTLRSRRFEKNIEWSPNSPDVNLLDYYFWDKVKICVYRGLHNNPFNSIDELKHKIVGVWDECVNDLTEIRKAILQFRPRLEAVVEKQGDSKNCLVKKY